MAISRKKILQKIASARKGIEYHLDKHVPSLIDVADTQLVEYWRVEVSRHISRMEDWAKRLSTNEHILAEAAEYRRRLDEMLDARLQELEQ